MYLIFCSVTSMQCVRKFRPKYLNHNIMHEPKLWDRSFQIDYVATPAMRKNYKNTTNEERHQAIMSCAVAFSHFMRTKLHNAQWWMDSGTLIGSLRGKKFIP